MLVPKPDNTCQEYALAVERRRGAHAADRGSSPLMEERASPDLRSLILAAAPMAGAIGVFGMIFGAAATAHLELALVIGMSLLVFSGALQFTTLGLLAAGGGALAIVATAIALNMRHVVLGAVLRPRIHASPRRRALMAWFLLDESFGLALAGGARAGFVLVASGMAFFIAWQVGTALGALGARLVAIEGLAGAIFPVLFIGLAAVTVRGRQGMLRTAIAAALVVGLSFVLPQAQSLLPILAAVAVSVPGARGR
jgi:predicted branched-subunit amino acid permease